MQVGEAAGEVEAEHEDRQADERDGQTDAGDEEGDAERECNDGDRHAGEDRIDGVDAELTERPDARRLGRYGSGGRGRGDRTGCVVRPCCHASTVSVVCVGVDPADYRNAGPASPTDRYTLAATFAWRRRRLRSTA